MRTTADSGTTREEFDRLLAALDRDRNRAGEIYESLRRRLTTYFRLQGFHEAHDLVDRAFDIAARRLGDARIEIENVTAYIAAIARKVRLEAEKERYRIDPLDSVPEIAQAGADSA